MTGSLNLSAQEALRSARETRSLEMGRNILSRTAAIFQEQFGTRPAVIVADETTMRVAGAAVLDSFRQAGHSAMEPFVYSNPRLFAEHDYVLQLENSLKTHHAIPVAVGSGTINDLTKLAAHRAGRPYMCVATAASMDGYTAFGASITCSGSKQTFNCPAPTAVLADIEVIRAAPRELTAAGYADLLAKITAGADWIVADAIGIEAINPQAWKIVQSGLRDAMRDPAGVRTGNLEAIGRLTEGLMLGGFAMQWAKSSRPASGAEHQFSHLWDMQHHTHLGAAPSHGFKVGIATLAVASFYEALLKHPIEKLDVEKCCARWPDEQAMFAEIQRSFLEKEIVDKATEEMRAKYIPRAQLREQLERLRKTWPDLKLRLQTHLLPGATLKQMLRDVGAPVEPEEIGISHQRLRDSHRQAYFLRRRFTVLDLAAWTGLLEPTLERIFQEHKR